MNREVHVRFCERFRGEIPLYLLDTIWFSSSRNCLGSRMPFKKIVHVQDLSLREST